VLASSARAQPTAHPVSDARLERAERLYVVEEFEQALEEYTAAYQIEPRPELLFHIGQCHRRLGRPEEALFFFRGYLERVPDAPDRAQVEALAAGEEAKLAVARRATPAPAAASGPTAPATETARAGAGWWRRWWFWTGAAVVVAGIGLGVGLGLSREAALPAGGLGTIDARGH
jgi:tetratricopeptide (TPR) repeat protein